MDLNAIENNVENNVEHSVVSIEETMHAALDKMIEKHRSNEYVYGRLQTYINTLLPIALNNATELQKQREERRNTLSANKDEFTARFLHKNNYFYSSHTELFLYYDGLHFVLKNEDDIHHQLLTTISSERCLREWRYKVNNNIIKRIKERSPLTVIPESATIQFVINTLYPAIFPSRNQAKYFLTIIGEGLKSLNSLIYILSPSMKDIVREIGNQCYTYFGLPNILGNLKFKYYDHDYSQCRLLSIAQGPSITGLQGPSIAQGTSIAGPHMKKKFPVPPGLTKYMIDFLCVATHYVARYGSADKFLQSCSETRLVEHALFLTQNTQESLVDTFISKSLTPAAASANIVYKNMIFLWKKFLDERAIPNIIFYEAFKKLLKNKLPYDEARDCFLGITSIQLPQVTHFMKFWEDEEEELEVEEIAILFTHSHI